MSKLYDEIGQFAAIPHAVIERLPEIGVDALAVYVLLRYHSGRNGQVYPSYDRLQQLSGLTRRRIAAAIRALISAGVIERRRRFGRSSVYILKYVPPSPISSPPELMIVQGVNYSSSPAELMIVPQVNLNKILINKMHLTRGESAPSPDLDPPPDVSLDPLPAPPPNPEPSHFYYERGDVMRLLMDAAGMAALPPRESERVEQLVSLLSAYGYERVLAACQQAVREWSSRRSRQGLPYRVTNMGWVDWAQERLEGGGVTRRDPSTMNVDELVEYYKQRGEL